MQAQLCVMSQEDCWALRRDAIPGANGYSVSASNRSYIKRGGPRSPGRRVGDEKTPFSSRRHRKLDAGASCRHSAQSPPPRLGLDLGHPMPSRPWRSSPRRHGGRLQSVSMLAKHHRRVGLMRRPRNRSAMAPTPRPPRDARRSRARFRRMHTSRLIRDIRPEVRPPRRAHKITWSFSGRSHTSLASQRSPRLSACLRK
jgi:hypothetical protein